MLNAGKRNDIQYEIFALQHALSLRHIKSDGLKKVSRCGNYAISQDHGLCARERWQHRQEKDGDASY